MQNERPSKPRPLPQVRYHPSIQAAGAAATETRAKQTPKPRAGPARAPRAQRPEEEPAQRGAEALRPEQVPPGLRVKVDRGLVKEVEVLTRGQRKNLDWHVRMQNQQQNKPSPPPQVRYHPSIQAAGAAATKTRAKQTPKPRADPAPAPKAQRPEEEPAQRGAEAQRPEEEPVQRGAEAQRPEKKPAQRGAEAQRPEKEPAQRGAEAQRPEEEPVQRGAEAQRPEKKPAQRGAEAQRPEKEPAQRGAEAQRPEEEPAQRGAEAALRPEQVPPGLGVKVDRGLVKKVEVLTRGQSNNPDWFAWRKNRITASRAHCIAHCRFVHGKNKTPPTSYLAAITGEGPRVQTRAMSWGVHMEGVAVRSYEKMKSAELGHPISVKDCGLFIDARRPWLAASPDGMVTDSQGGQWLLEVKCPYKHRQQRVEDACRTDSAFCLELLEDGPDEPPAYRLKTSHCYYTQVQCQLAVAGLKQADFVVFTLKETAIVPVTFDPDLWEETVSNLEVFYRDAVLPHLRERTQRQVEL